MRLGSVALVALCACGTADDLRDESSRSGLALVEVRGERIAVIPFDGPERYYTSEYGQPLTVAFGRAGRVVIWHPASMWRQTDLIATSINGEIIAEVRAPSPAFFPDAVNEQAGLMGFWGTIPNDDHPAGLHWATLDLSRTGSSIPWSQVKIRRETGHRTGICLHTQKVAPCAYSTCTTSVSGLSYRAAILPGHLTGSGFPFGLGTDRPPLLRLTERPSAGLWVHTSPLAQSVGVRTGIT
jgi:hypothetical protein